MYDMSVFKTETRSSILEICQEMIEAAKAGDLVRVEAARIAYRNARRREASERPKTIH